MSATYSIACTQCKVCLWVGQKGLRADFVYSSPAHIRTLAAFLYAHVGHALAFDDSQKMGGFEEIQENYQEDI